jgi:hypothetical protein
LIIECFYWFFKDYYAKGNARLNDFKEMFLPQAPKRGYNYLQRFGRHPKPGVNLK